MHVPPELMVSAELKIGPQATNGIQSQVSKGASCTARIIPLLPSQGLGSSCHCLQVRLVRGIQPLPEDPSDERRTGLKGPDLVVNHVRNVALLLRNREVV